jgi:hypothetical protein
MRDLCAAVQANMRARGHDPDQPCEDEAWVYTLCDALLQVHYARARKGEAWTVERCYAYARAVLREIPTG